MVPLFHLFDTPFQNLPCSHVFWFSDGQSFNIKSLSFSSKRYFLFLCHRTLTYSIESEYLQFNKWWRLALFFYVTLFYKLKVKYQYVCRFLQQCVSHILRNKVHYSWFEKSEFKDLVSLAEKESYFIFSNVLYKQINGVFMASPLGFSLHNAYIGLSWMKLVKQMPFGT